jgi:hypothetical protein
MSEKQKERHVRIYGYGSKNGYGWFRGDPDVWNEELSASVLIRTLSRAYMDKNINIILFIDININKEINTYIYNRNTYAAHMHISI